MSRNGRMTGAVAALLLTAISCAQRGAAPDAQEPEPWAVTAWGQRYEIFAEAGPLVAGVVSTSHTHVTVLEGFAPLTTGVVSAVLIDSTGSTSSFTQKQALRAGIFSVEIKPTAAGVYKLEFHVQGAGGTERIPSGRVRVGVPSQPGGLIEPPAKPALTAGQVAAPATGEAISFLKEQQWRIPFATVWAESGTLRPSVSGPGRVRPAAGGEAILTAPLDGVVAAQRQFYVGSLVSRGGTAAELRPRVASGRTLAEIQSEWTLAKDRLGRLERLFIAEAVSRAELDRARANVGRLQAESDAVRGVGRTIAVIAPFAGRIAEVMVTPGQAVEAGASLARLVQIDPLWIELGLRPEQAHGPEFKPVGLVIQGGPEQAPLSFADRSIRFVSMAPEVDRSTGLVQAILEVRGAKSLRVGSAVQVEVLLAGSRSGIVLPSEAIVDDAGVAVVYVQSEGESFERREVTIVARQGDRVLVQAIRSNDRIVTRGAAAIRRSAQMSSGEIEGHVH